MRRLLLMAFSSVGLAASPQVSPAVKTTPALECPPVMAIKVFADRYPGWSVHSNDPLRLSGADIAYVDEDLDEDEDATLDSDQTLQLEDEDLSVVSVFRLSEHPEAKHPVLVCHYGVHAQLSKMIPAGARKCSVVRHRRFDELNGSEFTTSCG